MHGGIQRGVVDRFQEAEVLWGAQQWVSGSAGRPVDRAGQFTIQVSGPQDVPVEAAGHSWRVLVGCGGTLLFVRGTAGLPSDP